MKRPNIVLTGFMGTGKSSVGRIVAEDSGRIFVDTDDLIVEQAGVTIAEIFEQEGEAVFRAMERQVARDLSGQTELVIASGGRMMLDPVNALLLSRGGLVYCLTASPQEILARLAVDDRRRPLLEIDRPAEKVRDLLAERAEGYGQFSQIDTNRRRVRDVVGDILARVELAEAGDEWRQPPIGRLSVAHPGGRYPVLVGFNLLPRLGELLAGAGIDPGPIAIITDDNVGPLYAGTLSGLDPAVVITVPAGEENKRLDTVRIMYDQMLAAGLDRTGTVVALGGGVVGDMAGFAAATYLRGVEFVQCPTTVLAMVDASVGGKTGVDLPQGKNLVGAFKQPLAVVADLEALDSLPAAEYKAGLAEVVKHGLISGQLSAFSFQPSALSLQPLILDAILVKRDVVEADPFERGRRKVLNLGHTFGHAIEQVSGYTVRHGEGVAMGLVAAAHLSAALGYARPELQGEIESILTQIGLPARIPTELPAEALLKAMGHDKKRAAGRLQFVLIRQPGDVFVSDQVPETAVRQTLEALRQQGD
ncbi:MAG TPA: 3-dehydroquinate synthase [Anaerolineae bacterium]|jgi:3-dehydroquinate synthase|nr:3-dehydroquinate synthase [Anaerolineae bacterium]